MTVVEAYLQPLAACLTSEVAARIVALRPNAAAEARLEHLRTQANEGRLTPQEREEYTEFVETLDFMGLLRAEARAVLEPRTT